ncbi:MAG: thiamine phosphate synthase, partial [Actinomycetota bacterium]
GSMSERPVDARLYLVAPSRLAVGTLAELVPELAAAGVDLIQLREKEMEAGDILRVGEPLAAACEEARVPFIVNDRPDVAFALRASGVHLGTNDLPTSIARAILGPAIVGRSSHSRDDIDAALDGSPDYLAVGPVYATPTKPDRPGTGLELIAHAAATVSIPWFAIGGINDSNLEQVLGAGAARIVVVRAITEAPDPPSAAARLKAMLRFATTTP